jgi:transposase
MSQLSLNLDLPDNTKSDPNQNTPVAGKKHVRRPNRNQIEFKVSCVDDLLPSEHRARDVWDYTSKLDLSIFHNDIRISEGSGGPGTIDPQILLTLWLYGILEGICSARHIARLCTMHHAYIWICGGVSINYHTLSDFRNRDRDSFLRLLQESIAIMWKLGLFNPEEAAQDGTRGKADAGSGSLKKEATLDDYLAKAIQYIEELEKELATNPSASTQREKAARRRAANDRKERLEQAQAELKEYKQFRIQSSKENHNKLTKEDIKNLRVSTTDPECRKMKMGDGGFRPAYNVQFATSTDKKVILGVDVVNTLDPGTLCSMMQTVTKNLKEIGCPSPSKWLADSAYANRNDAQQAKDNFSEITLYSPPIGNGKVDALTPRKTDNPAMIELRQRMGTEEAKVIYKKRGSTAEFPNATAKNRGMREFLVRGLFKVRNMALIYAVVHNMSMYFCSST